MVQFFGWLFHFTLITAFRRIDLHHLLELLHEPLTHVPLGIALFYETCSHKSVYHIVKLSDAHPALRDPVLPCLNW